MKLSIIIPHCNEYQNLFMTVQNMMMRIHECPDLHGQVEIIVVDNLSEDIEAHPVEKRQHRHDVLKVLHRTNTVDFMPKQWLAENDILRVIEFTGDQSILRSRQAGLDVARGEYILFSDCHVLQGAGAFSHAIETLENNPQIGELHGAHLYFFTDPDKPLYQYDLTLEDNFWGSWTSKAPNYVDDETPFKIPMSSLATVFYRRADLVAWGDMPKHIGIYGGDEGFMSMRTWIMGKQIWNDPRIRYAHLADIRGYIFNQRDFVKNTMLVAFLLGGQRWLSKIYERYRKDCAAEYQQELAMDVGLCLSCQDERDLIAERAQYTLDEVLEKRPWEN